MPLAPSELSIYGFLDVRDYLCALYETNKKEKKPFSYQQFGEILGFGKGSSYLYQICHKQRDMTEDAGKKMLEVLPLSRHEKVYFAALVKLHTAKSEPIRDEVFEELLAIRSKKVTSEVQRGFIEYFSKWYHAVVRELVLVPGFQPNSAWIASRVCPEITEGEARHSFELLQKLGMVRFDAKVGQWVQTDPIIEMPQDFVSTILTQNTRVMLDKIKESLLTVSQSEREISSVIMSIRDEDFVSLKRDILEFRDSVVAKYATQPQPQAVIHLSLAAIPLTQKGGEK